MSGRHVVVGGGIAGGSIAYHLSERTDEEVLLLERGSLSAETTFKSVAQFGFYGDETQYRMKRYGMALYNEFFADQRANPRYHSAGLLVASTEREGADELRRAVEEGDPSAGKTARGTSRDLLEYLPGNELTETLLLPPVDTDRIEGALFRPKVGYMSRPHELAFEFVERAEENGVVVEEGTAVEEVTVEDGRATGVVTADGRSIAAENVICAAGPWNPEVAASAGVEIPVEHTIAPVVRLRPPSPIEYDVPIISHHDSPYAFHRRSPEELLIGYVPDSGEKTRLDPATVGDSVPEEIRTEGIELLADLVPGWIDAEVTDEWVGVRSQTPDGNPVVGWTELEGFSIAAFHTSGIQLSPAVGKIVADQLIDGDPTDYYDAVSVSRFDGYDDVRSG